MTPPPHLSLPMLELWAYAAVPDFLNGAGYLKSDPHSCPFHRDSTAGTVLGRDWLAA